MPHRLALRFASLGLAALAAGPLPALGQSGAAPIDIGLRGTLASDAGADPADGADAAANDAPDPDLIAIEEAETRAGSSGAAAEPVSQRAARAAAVAPVAPAGRRGFGEEPDFYEPLGIRAGGFLFYPALTVSAGLTSNATGLADGEASSLLLFEPELRLRSDWSRHEVAALFSGSYQAFGDDEAPDDETTALAEANARLDISRDWTGRLSASYRLGFQEVTDPGFPVGADAKPAVHGLSGRAELERTVGPARLSGAVSLDRTVYEDATAGGVVIDQGDRDNSVGELRLRAGYELTPLLQPFVEAGAGRRVYDNDTDAAGFRREATISLLRGGIVYDSSPVLSGELAVGYRREAPEDGRLPTLSAFTVDGSLIWSPTRLTVVTLTAATAFNPLPVPGFAGSVVYQTSVDAAYLWRRNVSLHALGGWSAERYDGGRTDHTFLVGARAEWRLNRRLALTTRFTHEWTDRGEGDADTTTDTLLVGLRVQR